MKKRQLNETFTCESVSVFNDGSTLNESEYSSLIDGQYIIGIVEGQFFQPDGMSRNKRWYSRSLWENVLNSPDVKNRLLNRTMFGEIGHSDGPVTDMTLREGNASHIILDLWIDEKGRGMGRAAILNTQKGRDLKTYLGANAKLKVSTRGEGVYLDGQFHDGCPIIDPDSYELQTVDFVLNPGFLETSAKLTAQKESVDEAQKTNIKVSESSVLTKKEGEQRMQLDMESYVAELKEELKSLKEENKSLTEELKAKDKELLLKQYEESAEVKKISEAYEPFKKIGASAKSINETLKRNQKALENEQAKTAKLSEELQAYTNLGTAEQIEEAAKITESALNTIAAYQKVGTVEQVQKLFEQSQILLPQLKEFKSIIESYKECGSVEEIKSLKESAEKMLPQLDALKQYKALGTVEQIKEGISEKEAVLAQLKEAQELGETVKILVPKLNEMKKLEAYAERAHSIIEKYVATVGSLKKAQELTESRKETIKTVNIGEAVEISKKFGCTVESAAKMIKKFGSNKTTEILESKVQEKSTQKEQLGESIELVEEEAKMDKVEVNAKPETKTAQDFLKPGMMTNAFNREAFGKKLEVKPLDKLDGEKVEGTNAAQALLAKFKEVKPEVEAAPKTEKEPSQEDAEAKIKKLLKK